MNRTWTRDLLGAGDQAAFVRRLIVALLVMAAIIAPAAAMAQTDESIDEEEIRVVAPNLPLWRLRDADSEILILATVPALPTRSDWNRAPLRRALNGADALLVEDRMSIDPVTLVRLFTTRRTAFLNPHGARTQEFVEPALWARVEETARALDQNPRSLERMRPYVIGATLLNKELEAVGLDLGIDITRQARNLARDARVRIIEAPISSVRAGRVIDALSALPTGADVACLEDQLALGESAPSIMRQRADAWIAGDAERLHAFADVIDTSRCMTALASGGMTFADLTEQRVQGWTRLLIAQLDRPGRRVAVIDGDLFLSRDGVLVRLDRSGYDIEVDR